MKKNHFKIIQKAIDEHKAININEIKKLLTIQNQEITYICKSNHINNLNHFFNSDFSKLTKNQKNYFNENYPTYGLFSLYINDVIEYINELHQLPYVYFEQERYIESTLWHLQQNGKLTSFFDAINRFLLFLLLLDIDLMSFNYEDDDLKEVLLFSLTFTNLFSLGFCEEDDLFNLGNRYLLDYSLMYVERMAFLSFLDLPYEREGILLDKSSFYDVKKEVGFWGKLLKSI